MARLSPHDGLKPVSVKKAAELKAVGAVFVDIRALFEHNAQSIPGSISCPLENLPKHIDAAGKPVVFYCNSGSRTEEAAGMLRPLTDGPAYQLAGGLDAWKQQGYAVEGGDKGALVGADLLRRLLTGLDQANKKN